MKDYRSALDKDEDFSRAKEGIQKAQKLEKQAKKRDYYKILGVKRTASKKEKFRHGRHNKLKRPTLSQPHGMHTSWRLP